MSERNIVKCFCFFLSIAVSFAFTAVCGNSEWKWIPLLINNYGFETGTGGKPNDWKAPIVRSGEKFNAVWDTEKAANGKRCVRLRVDEFGGRSIAWTSTEFKVPPSSFLKGTAMVKVANLATSGKQGDGCNGIVHFFAADGKYIRNRQLFFSPKNHDWKKFTFRVKVPPKAVSAYLTLGALRAKGDFSFDDFRIAVKNTDSTSLPSPTNLADTIPIVIPQPYYESHEKEAFIWKYDKAAIIADHFPTAAIAELRKVLKTLGVGDVSTSSEKAETATDRPLFIFKPSSGTIPKPLSERLAGKNLSDQGYVLNVKIKSGFPVFLIQGSPRGAYYAVQTIRQYLRNSRKRKVSCGTIFDKPAFKYRGIISGSHSLKRLDMMARRKMNMILLVGEPHNSAWFKGLRDGEKKRHKAFLAECETRFIVPVPSIHPGYIRKNPDGTTVGKLLKFTDDALFEGMMAHFKDLYDIGYRVFDIAWDDMGRHGGQDKLLFAADKAKYKSVAEAHRRYTEKVYKRLKSIDPTITLWTIGMSYWLDGSEFEKNYFAEFGKLPKEIKFMSCGTFNAKTMKAHRKLARRNAVIWDNSVGTIDTEFIEPFKVHTGDELETLTDTYLFVLHDRKMLWDEVADYLWNGKRLNPVESAKRAVSVLIGPKYAELIQKTAAKIAKLKSAPISGDTSTAKIAEISAQIHSLNDLKLQLQRDVPKKISDPFIIQIEAITSELNLYLSEFKTKALPVDVKFLSKPPIIDGKVGIDEWSAAARFANFRLIARGKRPAQAECQTTAYMGWTKDKLYIAFKCDEPMMKNIKSFVTKRDEGVYHDDCVELFLDPDRKAASYYHIAVNSIGTIFDYFVNREPWNGNIAVATSKTEGSWTVEMSISLASMNQKVDNGVLWNFNLCRERYAGKPEFSSWALLSRRFHEPRHFWTMRFVGK